jgi:hypothetical protein
MVKVYDYYDSGEIIKHGDVTVSVHKYDAVKVYREDGDKAPCILNFVISFTLQLFTYEKSTATAFWTGGFVGSRSGLDVLHSR